MVDPANIELANKHKDDGNGFLKAKQFAEAAEAYSKAIELNPLNHVFYSNRSAALLSLGKGDKALEDADECVKIKPDWAKGHGRRGAALYALQRFDDALQAYDAGLAMDATNKQLVSGRGQAERAKQERSASSNPFATLGAQLSASPKFKAWMDEDPSFKAKVDLLQTTGVNGLNTLLQLSMQGGGGMDEKTEALLEALGLSMGGGEDGEGGGAASGGRGRSSAERRAEAEAAKKQAEEAEAARRRKEQEEAEAAMSPEERDALQKQRDAAAKKEEGVALYKQKKLEEAFGKFSEARELDPTDTLFLLNQASVRVEQDRPEDALAICEDAIKHANEYGASFAIKAKCLARKGGAYMKMGRFEEAAAAFEDSLTESDDRKVKIRLRDAKRMAKEQAAKAYVDPAKAAEAKERGNVLFKEKNFPGAIDEYAEAIKRDPENATYYHNRAQAYLKVVRPLQARDDAQKAIELDPTYVRAHARLGYAFMQLKEYHRAIKSFSTGLEYEEDNKECRQGFMDAERAIQVGAMAGAGGDEDDDKERLARAMQDPEIQGIVRDPLVQMALQRLQQGPEQAAQVLQDPSMSAKIQKLIAAGVLKMGSGPAEGGGGGM